MSPPNVPTAPKQTPVRRRTRTYDSDPAMAAKIKEILDFVATPFIFATQTGDLKPTLATVPLDGWLLCDGSTFDAETYPELAALLGRNQLPDLRGRALFGAGATFSVGATGGRSKAALTIANLPPHSHEATAAPHNHMLQADPHTHVLTMDPHTHDLTMDPHSHTVPAGGGDAGDGSNGLGGAGTTSTSEETSTGTIGSTTSTGTIAETTVTGSTTSNVVQIEIGSTGLGESFDIMPPFFAVNWMIKT